jgi:hypothetical protein
MRPEVRRQRGKMARREEAEGGKEGTSLHETSNH